MLGGEAVPLGVGLEPLLGSSGVFRADILCVGVRRRGDGEPFTEGLRDPVLRPGDLDF